tara:strand:- start:142 stop:369 length:228 start_codon:yes stop_codon:yes gene_type:complete
LEETRDEGYYSLMLPFSNFVFASSLYEISARGIRKMREWKRSISMGVQRGKNSEEEKEMTHSPGGKEGIAPAMEI